MHPPSKADLEQYARAVSMSAGRLRPWNPVDPRDLGHHVRNQSDRHRTFLIRALHPEGEHGIVGKVNVTAITRGRSLAATLGYDSYDPYAGRGLFTEGLALIVGIAFAPSPHGMGLHRLEACVQPGNTASAGALRRLGFTRRGQWSRYLWLADADGVEAWRDHIVYGMSREEWPAAAYAPASPGTRVTQPLVVVLATQPGPQLRGQPGQALARARRLAAELGVPLVRDLTPGPPAGEIADRLADAVTGAVLLTARPRAQVPPLLAAAGERGVSAGNVTVWPLEALAGERALVRVALEAIAAGATRPAPRGTPASGTDEPGPGDAGDQAGIWHT